ncbi:hypothetical protein CHH61_14500 [Shouchella clausii]|uniref:Uncharacterized protein n=1 Tax=Shouchella clausii TaxID=79880 RepID=A0A268RZS3_SHOCL|nr:hypothetical protein CHH61_14500 [Shouchella clausii]
MQARSRPQRDGSYWCSDRKVQPRGEHLPPYTVLEWSAIWRYAATACTLGDNKEKQKKRTINTKLGKPSANNIDKSGAYEQTVI